MNAVRVARRHGWDRAQGPGACAYWRDPERLTAIRRAAKLAIDCSCILTNRAAPSRPPGRSSSLWGVGPRPDIYLSRPMDENETLPAQVILKLAFP
jgi:hypothetical protein